MKTIYILVGINGPLNMAIVPRTPGYQVPYAARVKREAGVMAMAVGLITEPRHAEQILADGDADLNRADLNRPDVKRAGLDQVRGNG